MDNQLRQIIEEAWNDRALLAESRVREAVRAVIEELDKGRLRTAEPIDPSRSQWQVNEWVKKAILLYFPMQEMRTMRAGELEWNDKMDLKHGYEELGVRVVPHAVARYGAYISPGAILMPSYVNIGAWVGAGTMVDTWATVGSCAQVGERVHLSGVWAWAVCWNPCRRPPSSSRTTVSSAPGPSWSKGRTSAANRCWAPAW